MKKLIRNVRILGSNLRTKIFLYYFFSYMAITAVLFVAFAFLYTFWMNEVQTMILEHNIETLEHQIERLDTSLEEVRHDILPLLESENMSLVLDAQSDAELSLNTVGVLDLIDELYAIKGFNEIVDDVILYANHTDTVVTSTGCYRDSSFYYYTNYLYQDNSDYEQFLQQCFLQLPTATFNRYYNEIDEKSSESFYFLQCSTSALTYEKQSGMLLVRFDDTLLSDVTDGFAMGKNGCVSVWDRSGALLYENGANVATMIEHVDKKQATSYQEVTIEGQPYLSIYRVAEKSGLQYAFLVSRDQLTVSTHRFMTVAYTFLSLAVLVSLLLASYLSRITAGPLSSISELVLHNKRASFFGTFLKDLQYHIDETVLDNSKMQMRIEEQEKLMQDRLLHKLLTSHSVSTQDVAKLLQVPSGKLKKNLHTVMVMKLLSPEQQTVPDEDLLLATSAMVLNCVSEQGMMACDTQLDKTRTAFLLSIEWDVQKEQPEQKERAVAEQLRDIAKQCYREILDSSNVKVIFAIADIVFDVKEIGGSFEQAKEIMTTVPDVDTQPYYDAKELSTGNYDFYYPFAIESQLSELIRAGKAQPLKEQLAQIYKENFVMRVLNQRAVEHLFQLLYTTLIRSLGNVVFSVNQHLFLNHDRLASMAYDISFQHVMKEYLTVCDLYAQKKEPQTKQMEQIAMYLEQHFAECQLTVFDVAEQFGMKERDFYYFFKNTQGVTFSVYLENMRMEHAKQLLHKQEFPVEKIAEQVGYASTRSFQRAFKRVVGCTPNEFRQAT